MNVKRKPGRPGPLSANCITCRRRRKKCDRTRPVCQRCANGDFTCEGYTLPEADPLSSTAGPGIRIESFANSDRSIEPVSLPDEASNLRPSLDLDSLGAVTDYRANEWTNSRSGTLYRETPVLHRTSDLRFRRGGESCDRPFCGQETCCQHTTHQSSPLVNIRAPSMTHTSAYLFSVTKNPSPIPHNKKEVIRYVLGETEQLVRLSLFQPAYQHFSFFRDIMVQHFQRSDAALWTKYLACRIFEGSRTGAVRRNVTLYGHSLQRIEQFLYATPPEGISAVESYNRLAGILEVTHTKLMFSSGVRAYHLLRYTAPFFLQLACANPMLWPDSTKFTSVSLAHVLSSTSFELSRFIFLDALHSFAYGLPQIIEYDTSTPPIRTGNWPSEWIHGCPVELQFALIEINQRRGAGARVLPQPDWRPIEEHIKSWKPTVLDSRGGEAWKAVATLVVQESWRHGLLIYLYMAVCSVDSHDERVQASVQQIFQLFDSVSCFPTPSLLIHFLFQYLVVGICARSEKQRDTVYEKIDNAADSAISLFRGSDFAPVLEHLWHGAGANGQPVYWSDYVHSRQTMLPVYC